MSNDAPSAFTQLQGLRNRAKNVRSITESEDTVRNLKASQSVEAAFQASGIPSPPGDVAAIITNHVKSAIQGMPLQQVANMTPGSGVLGTSAMEAVNQFLSSLTPSQREAVKAGVNPLDATGMMKLDGALKTDVGNFARLSARGGSESSARFDSASSADAKGDWSSPAGMAQMRDLAVRSGVGWAANSPEILRLGPTAIQILAQTGLHQDTYKKLTKAGLSPKGSVGVAAIALEQGKDANTSGQQIAADLTTINNPKFTSAIKGVAELHVPPANETPQQKEIRLKKIDAANKKARDAGAEHMRKHPQHKGQVGNVLEGVGAAVKKDDLQTKATNEQAKTTGQQIKAETSAVEKKVGSLAALNAPTPSPAADPAKPKTSPGHKPPDKAPKPT